jgi:LPS export ABC transporter protein LptC
MCSGAKQGFLLPALLISMLLLNACDSDLQKIKEISAKQSTNSIDSTTMVDVIYSDSARVKLHMTAPLLLQHQDIKKPVNDYDEMPHGVKIVFFDTSRNESGSIIADSAIQHTQAKIIEFHKNVVAVNAQGDTYKSDELIWDQVKKIIYSNKPVQITTTNGTIINGSPFTSDEKLVHPLLGKSTGVFQVSDMPGNQ